MTSPASPFSYPTARLEALRGLAAISVAVFHSLLVLQGAPTNYIGVDASIFLFNGRAAVTLFFVLSGFVLSLSLRRAGGTFRALYLRFAIRRVFRIYPAMIVSTVVVVALIYWCRTLPPNNSIYMHGFVIQPVNAPVVLKQLALITFLNPVTWTLRMEVVCSLLLPLALWVERRRPAGLLVVLAVLIMLGQIFPTVMSVVVMPAFLIGYLLPLTSRWWASVEKSRWQGVVLFLIGIPVLIAPRSQGWPLADASLVEAIGAALIVGSIVFGAHLHLFSFFDWHPIKVAGRVSYSYYVYHFPILALTQQIILPRLPAAFVHDYPVPAAFLLWIASSLIAFPVAMLSYAAIEKPFIKLGSSLVAPKAEAGRSPA